MPVVSLTDELAYVWLVSYKPFIGNSLLCPRIIVIYHSTTQYNWALISTLAKFQLYILKTERLHAELTFVLVILTLCCWILVDNV